MARTDSRRANHIKDLQGGFMSNYHDFLGRKAIVYEGSGIRVDRSAIHSFLKPFQADLTLWALRKGRAAIFADTGLGKTYMEAEWARLVHEHTGLPVLILAPLGVAKQTVRLAYRDIGLDIAYVRDQFQVVNGVNITNYEMLERFDPAAFSGVVLDESSILKNLAGKTRQRLTAMFAGTPYKLCGTATPAPNDDAEIGQHAEFLGIMSHVEMQATFFVHREPKDDVTGKKKSGARQVWNLRKHAEERFYRWLASWGISVRKPSDLGYSDDGYILPPLSIQPIYVATDYAPDDRLFFTGLSGIGDRSYVRQATVSARVPAVANLVNANDEQWIVWCGLNVEANSIAAMIPGAVNVQGSDSVDTKTAAFETFQEGTIRVLVTKPSIAGFGLNFQNAHNMAFVGLSDSWEDYYQCIRRQYRFGQSKPVNVYVVIADIEEQIYQNIMRKEAQARNMAQKLIENIQQFERAEIDGTAIGGWQYQTGEATGNGWRYLLGDSVERLAELADNSIDLSVFSPPFQSLYTYSPTERDLGNSRNADQFNEHFGYIVDNLLRVTKPGRICAVHVADVPAMMVRDGYIGLKDFSGDVIKLFQERGWVYDARIPIDKNQQAQSIRTHSKALTMSSMQRDRSWLRPALPDYILKFRKPGDNLAPVKGGMSGDEWIELANPTWPNEFDRCAEWGAWQTWYGIQESDTLQGWQAARGNDDERHICPLQLGTIERCIRLWTNPGEVVLDPFGGIASTGDQAIRFGRKFIGCELKPEYWQVGVRNLKAAEADMNAPDLFSWAAMETAEAK